MDRGPWWAIVYGVTRVRHDLVTKPPPYNNHTVVTHECLTTKSLVDEFQFAVFPISMA